MKAKEQTARPARVIVTVELTPDLLRKVDFCKHQLQRRETGAAAVTRSDVIRAALMRLYRHERRLR